MASPFRASSWQSEAKHMTAREHRASRSHKQVRCEPLHRQEQELIACVPGHQCSMVIIALSRDVRNRRSTTGSSWFLRLICAAVSPCFAEAAVGVFFSTPTRFPPRATKHTKGNFAMNAYESLSHTKWERKCYVIQAFARRYEFEISNSRYALIRAIE